MSALKHIIYIATFVFLTHSQVANSQQKALTAAEKQKITIKTLEDTLTFTGKKYANAGRVRIKKITPVDSTKQLIITTNETLSYLPLRPANVDSMYDIAASILNVDYPNYSVSIISDDIELRNLIPGVYRNAYKTPYNRFKITPSPYPLTRNLSQPTQFTAGLQNRHIALWHSHGKYYYQTGQKWVWQRPVLFQTAEDIYTMSYILPFLVPMLENAGANVLLPRERDTQTHEVIVDNDKSSGNSDFNVNDKQWKPGVLPGFAHLLDTYIEKQNPFAMGSYLQSTTIRDSLKATQAEWTPDIPESGKYAVYIAYKSLPNSTRDARYTVRHAGGITQFSVNQNMGGGTWIYLGHFQFNKGKNNKMGVSLSNFSSDAHKAITADAVKIGGGMGNISRKRANEEITTTVGKGKKKRTITKTKEYTNFTTSQYPRYLEGARYWLQWAGAPDSVYSRTNFTNDYSDDFQSRGFWVNYLAGGSQVIPEKGGLKIPLDMAFALHTDAGTNRQDSIIGTLAIYTVLNSDKKTVYANNTSRWNAREMTDMIQTQVVNDIRQTFNTGWTRRGLWNKNYSESRVPEVPTMLLELLSHQNFGDMRFGLDPRFRFTVSRAIYKGMLRYIAMVNGLEYMVQPLPVTEFSSRFISSNEVELSWSDVEDKLERTAKAEAYIVYTRKDDGGFDNGVLVKGRRHYVKIKPGAIYSFKVEAVNRGGKSFPSEILSVHKAPGNKPEVMIVNGFTRISAPQTIQTPTQAGFNTIADAGVPYLSDISYTGMQTEFDRSKPYIDDARPGHGASNTNYEDKEIAGNSFDYPYIHGKAIKAAGYTFVSTSKAAVISGKIKLEDYVFVDLVLGKERQHVNPLDSSKYDFVVFEPEMRDAIKRLTREGGNLIISGSDWVSDFIGNTKDNRAEKEFMEKTLRISWQSEKAMSENEIDFQHTIKHFYKGNAAISTSPNSKIYYVENPDVIRPSDSKATELCKYPVSQKNAGIIFRTKYGVCAFGFPLETITEEEKLEKLMKDIFDYFED